MKPNCFAEPAPTADVARCARDVALIVNTYQKPRHLALVLASIAAQEGVEGRFEVIVSDDGSTDGTADVLARRNDVEVIHHPVNRGYGAALATAFAAAVAGPWD
ncbi:MAG: glycosyltransferase family 2 protein, partial [Planctomycetia bacterium]